MTRAGTSSGDRYSKCGRLPPLSHEARHRQAIAYWWRKQYEKASPSEKAELAAQLLELDEEVQQRRNNYIKKRWLDARRATGAKTVGIEPVYDAWRQEVISYFLDIPNPELSSVS